MENTSFFSELYSHPGKHLEEHLINVSKIAIQNLTESPIEKIGDFSKDEILEVVKICGLSHDLGKATKYFQTYLNSENKEKIKETRHSLLSSIATYYLVTSELSKNYKIDENRRKLLAFASFLAVKRHHGDMVDVLSEPTLLDSEKDLLKTQVDSIESSKLFILYKNLKSEGISETIDKNVLMQWIEKASADLSSHFRKLRKLKEEKTIDFYLLFNLIFSLLIDADKSEVSIGGKLERKYVEINHTIVNNYKAKINFDMTLLNELREKAYKEVIDNKINLDQRIMSLNLPTGMGKTFTSFAFALKLRNEIIRTKKYVPRIIYSLPFLSIIDQNADIFEKILEAGKLKPDSSLLLKHHHLSEVYYKSGDNEYEADQAKILIEGWNSEIVVTTFVQLFHTLISNKNSTLRKFHRLAGSIIILDEVQSVPLKYWLLIKEIFNKLVHEFDSYVIFVTATQPLIFEKKDMNSLISPEGYFSKLDRVIIKSDLKKSFTLEDFVNNLNITKNKSYLFIMNTIGEAKNLYSLLKEKYDYEILFLSSHVTPFERMERIKKIREGNTRILITTQLVEAGVDIDFDVVYRDLAPLDSISQSAGRCNRNWRNQRGEVNIISLKDDRKNYSSYVYDPILLDTTKKILMDNNTIVEKNYLSIIEKYFYELTEKKSKDESRDLLKAIYCLKYTSEDESKGISDFRLIEEDYPKIDVFIELNDDAKGVWNEFESIKEIRNLFERRIAFSKIKSKFYKYVISIPINVKNLPSELSGFRYVNMESLDDYYDEKTGFKLEGKTPIW
jgi:CRISPR-associated endonuclease/helicase Cas3